MNHSLSTDGHLGSFQDLKIMDKAAMSILAQHFLGEFGYLCTTSIDMSCHFCIIVISVFLVVRNGVHFYSLVIIIISFLECSL